MVGIVWFFCMDGNNWQEVMFVGKIVFVFFIILVIVLVVILFVMIVVVKDVKEIEKLVSKKFVDKKLIDKKLIDKKFGDKKEVVVFFGLICIQQFNVWGVYFYMFGVNKVCYVFLVLVEKLLVKLEYGDNFFLVIQCFGQNIFYELQVMVGYVLKVGFKVKVMVDIKFYMMFIKDKFVWFENVVEEFVFVGVFKFGYSLKVEVVFLCGILIFYIYLFFGILVVLKQIEICK